MALDSTNSYVTLAEANTFFGASLNTTAWTNATDPTKEAALQMATRMIDMRYTWKGRKADYTQPLAWPRWGMYDEDRVNLIPENVVPVRVKNATCELAGQLLKQDALASLGPIPFTDIKLGPLEITVDSNASNNPIPNIVVEYLAPYITGGAGGGIGVAQVVRT